MSRKRLLIVGLAALALLVGGVAYASIPDAQGVIHGCYKTSNPAQGAVIAIDSAASCPSGFAVLNWSQLGQVGVLYLRQEAGGIIPPGTLTAVVLDCPTGKRAISAGFDISTQSDKLIVVRSEPRWYPDYPPQHGLGWMVQFRNTSSQDAASPAVTVVCVNGS